MVVVCGLRKLRGILTATASYRGVDETKGICKVLEKDYKKKCESQNENQS